MILTKYDLLRAYPELCRELIHEAGLAVRKEMIRRSKLVAAGEKV
jgi:hypothetical protein